MQTSKRDKVNVSFLCIFHNVCVRSLDKQKMSFLFKKGMKQKGLSLP